MSWIPQAPGHTQHFRPPVQPLTPSPRPGTFPHLQDGIRSLQPWHHCVPHPGEDRLFSPESIPELQGKPWGSPAGRPDGGRRHVDATGDRGRLAADGEAARALGSAAQGETSLGFPRRNSEQRLCRQLSLATCSEATELPQLTGSPNRRGLPRYPRRDHC